MGSIKSEVLSNLFRSTTNLMAFEQFLATLPFGLNAPDQAPAGVRPGPGPIPRRENLGMNAQAAGNGDGEGEVELVIPQRQKTVTTVGRNEPCPCGSGKKYKNCHGRVA
jgi:preprotein translocase subunit SecA